ncbi:cell division protein DamX [Alteromonas ponticola]|uniref:Cell division protein DamX n=1 Tax=Alteromonas aquimaris TaxID=2998417 RepID=A0ABT3PAK8_9ALTE|nr:cell division protein DamX [Alteromonas aquimaris]MCW8109744.1 cell division protein DamX [Alteromonas aquimaris]
MHSELHDRLEYLVNYSSQLIFVSSDSVAQQQKTLEAFVFNQPNETDIAFVTAHPKMEIADYRGQLCRQLLGQTVGSYVRPLNELLAALNNHDGPILITITQAQHMPDQLLQELWDLVLQSRFAANKQHLNVLVFGESQWAERAKQWLPAKNTTTPLLISSQSVLPSASELTVDKLIAQRRQEFEKHLAARYSTGIAAPSSPRHPAIFWSVIAMVFLLIFSAIVAWLYNEKLIALFQPLTSPEETTQVESVEIGTAYEELISQQAEPLTDLASEDAPPADADTPEQPVEKLADTESSLVASWPDALAQTASRSADSEEQDDSVKSTAPENQPAVMEQAQQDRAEDEAINRSSQQPVRALTVASVNDTDIQADSYYIQLAGLKDELLLYRFVKDHDLTAVVKMYKTQRYGGDWFVLLFHQPFQDIQDARHAVANLPLYPTRDKAFVKAGRQIKAELNQ